MKPEDVMYAVKQIKELDDQLAGLFLIDLVYDNIIKALKETIGQTK